MMSFPLLWDIFIRQQNPEISNCSELMGEQYITNVRHDMWTIMEELLFR